MSNDPGRVRELLAEAVKCLDEQSPLSSLSSGGPGPSGLSQQLSRRPSHVRPSLRLSGSSFHAAERGLTASALAERDSLFNIKGKSAGGVGRKKRKFTSWVHEFVCLAKTDQDKTPTAMERAGLISSGKEYLHLFFYWIEVLNSQIVSILLNSHNQRGRIF